ncbi:MAG: group 1 truncated hemoglobin [Nocardiopsaceae bacterium]|nr:group 1 truncated hemoglobin [Nocardiopsaceae bacterium]
MPSQSMYDEIGGKAAVTAVVDDFYNRLLADPSLANYFSGKDMKALKKHQRALVTVALGGSDTYTGQMMGPAHAGLNITGPAFDSVLEHLKASLASKGVAEDTIGKIVAILEPLRGDVVQEDYSELLDSGH